MLTRVNKEFHHIRFCLVFSLLITLIFWICTRELHPYIRFSMVLFVNLAHIALVQIMSVQIFGSEFRYKTIERTLVYPIKRSTVWWEKWFVLFAAILVICVVKALHFYSIHQQIIDERYFNMVDTSSVQMNYCIFTSGMLLALFYGPLLSIHFKKILPAFWCSMLAVVAFYILFASLTSFIEETPYYKKMFEWMLKQPILSYLYDRVGFGFVFYFYLLPWCIPAFWLARRLWKRLEV